MSFSITAEELAELTEKSDVQHLEEFGGVEGLAEKLQSDLRNGIDENDIEERKTTFGENVLPEKPPKSFFKLLFEALKETMLILLMVIAVISIILGLAFPEREEDRKYGWIEGFAIIMAVIIVSTVTAFNDFQKDKQFRALNKESSRLKIKVVRNGESNNVEIDYLLCGDLVILGTGDQVPADGILVEGHDLRIDESVMTGELKPVKKNEEVPFLMSGCQVAEGYGKMLITAVGVHSEWGKTLLRLSQDDENDQTPLEEKLDKLANLIGKGGILFAIATFVVLVAGWLIRKLVMTSGDAPTDKWGVHDAYSIVSFIVISVTIVVVAVPEGLPLAVTISLAYSVKKMMKDNCLVRKLAACETMGGCTNICSDKTGTLTLNEMQVTKAYIAGQIYSEVDELPTSSDLNPNVLKRFTTNASVNSTAELVKPRGDSGKEYEIQGNRTEAAILIQLRQMEVDYKKIRTEAEKSITKVFTFSSKKKRMSTVVKDDGENILYCKGASEIVLDLCDRELDSKGEEISLDDSRKKEHLTTIENMAKAGLRTLAFGYKSISETKFNEEDEDEQDRIEQGMCLIGIVGIKDPLRPEVGDAVAQCKRSGIIVRMVTGDNILTAQHIARECGILDNNGVAIEGPNFRKLTDEELDEILPKLQVLARSSPDDKFRLVKRLRDIGEVVAVTGDGTNDGLALKEADVGLSMGLSGTQIAKEASDIVITDDNFSSIVKAVLWGRSIFENIRKFLTFQLTVNIVALVITIIASLTSFLIKPAGSTKDRMDPPLTAVQLLWVNLIMDTFAALALATEPPIQELLNRKPLGRKAGLFTWQMWVSIITQSVYQLVFCLIIYYMGYTQLCVNGKCLADNMETNNTIVFNVFVFCQVFNEFNCRKINMEFNILANIHKSFMFLVIFSITVTFQFVIVQFFGRFTNTQPLNWYQWLVSVLCGLLCIPFSLLVRIITRLVMAIRAKKHVNEEYAPMEE